MFCCRFHQHNRKQEFCAPTKFDGLYTNLLNYPTIKCKAFSKMQDKILLFHLLQLEMLF